MSVIDESQALIKLSSLKMHQDRLSEVLPRTEKILIYKSENGKVVVYLNLAFRAILDEKLDRFSSFWYNFYCLFSLSEELNIHKALFVAELNNLEAFYSNLQRTIDSDIAKYRRQQQAAQIAMDQLLAEEEKEVGRRQVEIELTDRLINLKDKAGYVHVLIETKEKIMAYAQRKGVVERDLETAKETLECLDYLKLNLTTDMLGKNREAFQLFLHETSEVYEYLENVRQQDFQIMANPDFLNIQTTLNFSAFLCEKINHFHRIFADLMHLVHSSRVNVECIELIRIKWDFYQQCAGFIAARAYADAELDYYLGKKNKAEFRYDALYARDHLKRTGECLETLISNTSQVNNEIQSVHIAGGVDYSTTTQSHSYTYTDNQGTRHSGSVSFTHVSSVSHNLHLVNHATPKIALDPSDISISKKTVEAEIAKDRAKDMYAKVFVVWNQFKDIYDQYEARKKAVVDHKNTIIQHLEKLNEDYSKICKLFLKFFKSFEIKSFRIDESFNCCLFSLILKYSNIEPRPGCCGSRLKKPYLTKEIPVSYIINSLVKVLKINRKKLVGSCYKSSFFQLLSCEEIDLDDIRTLIFDLRILGSLKNNNSGLQNVESEARDEEFDRSLFEIMSKSIQLACIKKQKHFQINLEKTLAFVHYLQEEGEKILKTNKYDDLVADYRKFKFSVSTKLG